MRSRLPVLRSRRRYMIFELESEDTSSLIQARDLMNEIASSQFSLFGDEGAAKNRLRLISFDGRVGLIRFSHLHLNQTRATLAAVHSIRGIKAAIRTKGVSGTIKSAREKFSGCIIRTHGVKVDLCPDDRYKSAGSDAQFMGLTSLDLFGGHEDADGTADGL